MKSLLFLEKENIATGISIALLINLLIVVLMIIPYWICVWLKAEPPISTVIVLVMIFNISIFSSNLFRSIVLMVAKMKTRKWDWGMIIGSFIAFSTLAGVMNYRVGIFPLAQEYIGQGILVLILFSGMFVSSIIRRPFVFNDELPNVVHDEKDVKRNTNNFFMSKKLYLALHFIYGVVAFALVTLLMRLFIIP
mgnify:CR=1 FL=1